jgi:hypothetical protein
MLLALTMCAVKRLGELNAQPEGNAATPSCGDRLLVVGCVRAHKLRLIDNPLLLPTLSNGDGAITTFSTSIPISGKITLLPLTSSSPTTSFSDQSHRPTSKGQWGVGQHKMPVSSCITTSSIHGNGSTAIHRS